MLVPSTNLVGLQTSRKGQVKFRKVGKPYKAHHNLQPLKLVHSKHLDGLIWTSR